MLISGDCCARACYYNNNNVYDLRASGPVKKQITFEPCKTVAPSRRCGARNTPRPFIFIFPSSGE